MESGFSQIPAKMLKLPPELYHLWGAIRSTMPQGPAVKTETLCELTGKSERQVLRNLVRLAICGAIRIETPPGQDRLLFSTPETFQPEKLVACPKKSVPKESTPMEPEPVQDDTRVHDTHDMTPVSGEVTSMTCETTSVSCEMSPMTCEMTSVSPHNELKNIKINKSFNKTPFIPQDPQKAKNFDSKPDPAKTPTSPVRSKPVPLDSYQVLDKFRKAAGAKLALGDFIPSTSAPPGFLGVLNPSLDRQWYDFLHEYASPLNLPQEELEKRFTSLGKYFALGKNYWVKDEKIISLRWFCNPVHRNKAYELLDEAVTWDQKPTLAPEKKSSPPPKEPTPEEKRRDLQTVRATVSQMPTSTKEVLSQLLGTIFKQEIHNPVEIQSAGR